MTGQKYKSLLFLKRIHLYVFIVGGGGKREEGVRAQRGCPFRGLRPSKPL